MAATAPMRDGPPAGSGTGGDSRVTTTSASSTAAATTTNFEYDDNEWDIGIGNLIIDLDADIEKTNEKSNVGNLTSGGSGSMAAASATNTASGGGSSSGSSSKSNKSNNCGNGSGTTNSGSSAPPSTVEHSATVDNKSLKMKIKRTKPGSKSSEAKHEIVKSNEQNSGDASLCNNTNTDVKSSTSSSGKHSTSGGVPLNASANCNSVSANVNNVVGSNKRGSSSSHRRDKTKDKHPQSGDKNITKLSTVASQSSANHSTAMAGSTSSNSVVATDLNGIVRTPVQRVMFPIQTNGPGPPNASGPPPSPSKDQSKPVISAYTSNAIPITCAAQQTSSALVTATPVATNSVASGNINQSVSTASSVSPAASSNVNNSIESANSSSASANINSSGNGNAAVSNVYNSASEDGPQSPSSPPCKKIKTANCLINDSMETKDACVGTSISTMTEPDCLGPCEPGTSVTLEGIVWHETEGVLVVNVTWRGKTYVGTLLDCTRHDWAPPRFCDSPTSDLDARLPKGRAKRGRAATNDLSNFTETRSSVHSKLRSSSNGSNKSARKGLSNSPTPFVPPRPDSSSGKRKSRPPEEESASPQANGKKSKSISQTTAPASPPSSPTFLECPEANCCKKYKHMNGLKYHQSHAHGGACAVDDDDATKESGSMSETEEMPSPADQQSIKSERKYENSESEPATPISDTVSTSLNHPSSPHTQPVPQTNLMTELEPVAVEPSPPAVDNKTVVKPGVLRFAVPPGIEDITASQMPASVSKSSLTTCVSGIRPITTPISTLSSTVPLTLNTQAIPQPPCLTSPSPPSISQQIPLSPSQPTPTSAIPHSFSSSQQLQQTQPVQPLPMNPSSVPKLPQFKVKPASALLQDDKTKDKLKLQVQRKKNRKSPAGSPHSHAMEQSQFKLDNSNRDEVRSPAYSDISDDGAPVLEAEILDSKNKPLAIDKKALESSGAHSPHAIQHYNMYPYYGQPPFLVPSVQPETKSKDDKIQDGKLNVSDKDKKEAEIAQKFFYPYDYVPGYPYNLGQNYPLAMVSSNCSEKEIKEENKSPGPTDLVKQPAPSVLGGQNVNQYLTSISKNKMDMPGKIQNEPYANIKDQVDARNPLSATTYLNARQQQQQQLQQQHMQHPQLQPHQIQQQPNLHNQPSQQQLQQQQIQQHQLLQQQQQQQMQQHQLQQHQLQQSHQSQQQQHDDLRRFYMYPEQRRKEQHSGHSETPLKATPPPNSMSTKSSATMSGSKHKDKQLSEEKKDEKMKQEGVKPTMETQGPPPPPTSSYAYFHSNYLQSPHYGAIPFDPSHSMYRPMIVPTGPYGNSPYLHHAAQMHPQIPRYHAPEDLSRPPSGSATKALDILHHQASQYYPSSHKIHELQERAIKSPTPKVSTTNASPSATANGQQTSLSTPQLTPTSTSDRLSVTGSSQNSKTSSVDGKDSRSPPPQRHVHTHHHTHVGLGYPLLPGQYPAPYGAAVLASEQASAVASAGSNPYSPK